VSGGLDHELVPQFSHGIVQPEVMGRVLGIVYRCIATHLARKAGFSRKTAQTGASSGGGMEFSGAYGAFRSHGLLGFNGSSKHLFRKCGLELRTPGPS